MYLKMNCGSNGLKEVWSFTFVKPPQASSAAASPFGVNPAKCRMVMFRRRLMLERHKSPTSVIEQYDKFTCEMKNANLELVWHTFYIS